MPIPIQSPQTVAISSTPGMKTIPSETGSAIVSSAADDPGPDRDDDERGEDAEPGRMAPWR